VTVPAGGVRRVAVIAELGQADRTVSWGSPGYWPLYATTIKKDDIGVVYGLFAPQQAVCLYQNSIPSAITAGINRIATTIVQATPDDEPTATNPNPDKPLTQLPTYWVGRDSVVGVIKNGRYSPDWLPGLIHYHSEHVAQLDDFNNPANFPAHYSVLERGPALANAEPVAVSALYFSRQAANVLPAYTVTDAQRMCEAEGYAINLQPRFDRGPWPRYTNDGPAYE
jgi:hypothetical protein